MICVYSVKHRTYCNQIKSCSPLMSFSWRFKSNHRSHITCLFNDLIPGSEPNPAQDSGLDSFCTPLPTGSQFKACWIIESRLYLTRNLSLVCYCSGGALICVLSRVQAVSDCLFVRSFISLLSMYSSVHSRSWRNQPMLKKTKDLDDALILG